MSQFSTVLFDLDGTLTDPLEGITKAVQYALRHYGIQVEDNTTLSCFIGPPLVESFQEFYGFSPEKAAEATLVYREYFEETGIYQNKLLPGVRETLEHLRDRGLTLMVASSKPEVFVRRILDMFELSGYFAFAGGSDLEGKRLTKADVIEYVLAENGITDRSGVVMVGDRKHDVEGAAACGLPCIGLLLGYGSRSELEGAGAMAVAEDFDQMEKLI